MQSLGVPLRRITSRDVAVAAGIAFAGLVISLFASQLAGQYKQDAVRAHVEELHPEVVSDIGAGIERATRGVSRFADLSTATQLPPPADYRWLWAELQSALPGNVSVLVTASVPAEDLQAVAQAEQETTPGFAYRVLRDPSPPDGHLVIVRAPLAEGDVGIDLSAFDGIRQRLREVPVDVQSVFPADARGPDEDVSGQLQVIEHRIGLGPDGQERSMWTAVEIDVVAIASQVVGRLPDGFALEVELPFGQVARLFDADVSEPLAVATSELQAAGIDAVVTLSADRRAVETVTPRFVFVTGLLASLAAAVAWLLMQFVRGLFVRLDRSDQVARIDSLTELANRRWLVEHLQRVAGRPVGVLFCDLDHFKEVNDDAGHGAGDDVLVELARRWKAALTDQVQLARFGGDEFVAVVDLPVGADDVAVVAELESVAQRFVAALQSPFSVGDDSRHLSASIGSAWRWSADTTGEELLGRADRAMVIAKQSGRGHVVYDQALHERELDRMRLVGEVAEALDQGDLLVHYQPIVDPHGQVQSYEALVRWRRNGAMVSPAVFLPVVEDLGRMPDLGRIVLRIAIRDFARSIDGPHDERTLHVNVDPSQMLEPEFVADLDRVMHDQGLEPKRLVLELTEGGWKGLDDDILDAVDRVSASGVGVAIDDFGSAYSSLARILELRSLDELKVDRSVVRRIADEKNRVFIAGLVDITQRLNVVLIAEGIENADEFADLVEAGVERFQGFFFGRPGPAEEVMARANDPAH